MLLGVGIFEYKIGWLGVKIDDYFAIEGQIGLKHHQVGNPN
jgi:hypothetical protein